MIMIAVNINLYYYYRYQHHGSGSDGCCGRNWPFISIINSSNSISECYSSHCIIVVLMLPGNYFIQPLSTFS